MALRRSAEDYLEAIYVLKQKKGVVRSIDVAHHLDYSKPSVSRAVNNLRKDGYLDMMADGELKLTPMGESTAMAVYERHTVLTQLFISLGVPEAIATEDACRVEHAISPETFECLKAAHRNRYKGADGAKDSAKDPDKKKKKKKKKD